MKSKALPKVRMSFHGVNLIPKMYRMMARRQYRDNFRGRFILTEATAAHMESETIPAAVTERRSSKIYNDMERVLLVSDY